MSAVLPKTVSALIAELRKLPGVGEKTATRYVLNLLARGPDAVSALSAALKAVGDRVQSCAQCGFLSEGLLCVLCEDQSRDPSVICVVESDADLIAIEKVGEYKGLYHVLGGAISALRGIGPENLSITKLLERVDRGGVKEVIVATSADAEGETTALYVRKVLEDRNVLVTRPATGIPIGSSIEFLDAITLMRALRGRKQI